MALFYFARKKRSSKRCVKPRRYNVKGSPCNKIRKSTCKRTSGCSYTKKRGCSRRKGPKMTYSPDSTDFSNYVANAPYSAPEVSMSGDDDLGAYGAEAGISFFGRRRRSSFGKKRKSIRYRKSARSGCSMLNRANCRATSMCEYVKNRGCRRKAVKASSPGYSMKAMDADDDMAAYDQEAGFTWMGRKKCPKGKRGLKCRRMLRKYKSRKMRKGRKSRKTHRRRASFGRRKHRKSSRKTRRKHRKSGRKGCKGHRNMKKIPKSLAKKARKLGIKTTKKVGSRRVCKKLSVIKKQIARKMRMMRRSRR